MDQSIFAEEYGKPRQDPPGLVSPFLGSLAYGAMYFSLGDGGCATDYLSPCLPGVGISKSDSVAILFHL